MGVDLVLLLIWILMIGLYMFNSLFISVLQKVEHVAVDKV